MVNKVSRLFPLFGVLLFANLASAKLPVEYKKMLYSTCMLPQEKLDKTTIAPIIAESAKYFNLSTEDRDAFTSGLLGINSEEVESWAKTVENKKVIDTYGDYLKIAAPRLNILKSSTKYDPLISPNVHEVQRLVTLAREFMKTHRGETADGSGFYDGTEIPAEHRDVIKKVLAENYKASDEEIKGIKEYYETVITSGGHGAVPLILCAAVLIDQTTDVESFAPKSITDKSRFLNMTAHIMVRSESSSPYHKLVEDVLQKDWAYYGGHKYNQMMTLILLGRWAETKPEITEQFLSLIQSADMKNVDWPVKEKQKAYLLLVKMGKKLPPSFESELNGYLTVKEYEESSKK